MTLPFALSARHDVGDLRARFAASGRVEIPGLVTGDGAGQLREHLRGRSDWVTVLNAGERVYEIPRVARSAMSDIQLQELDLRVGAAARTGFQYRYEAIRIADDPQARADEGTLLTAFVDFMSSSAVLTMLEEVTGIDGLDFADGQATAYGPGDFLTRHDDDVAGKRRRAAYVFGLTPDWRAEWGGLLMFHRPDGNIDEAYAPAMGSLRLFTVPVPHSVSYVVPFAPEARLSVTGWLRTGSPDQSSE